jgi:RHS repeat-associated protein
MAHQPRRARIVRLLSTLALFGLVNPGFGSPGSVLDMDVPILGGDLPKSREIADGDGSVSTQTGAFQYSYPIAVPPGRLDVQPSLTLNYSSQAPLLGGVAAGWSLSIPEVRRDPTQSRLSQQSTSFVPRYVTTMAGGNVLIAVSEPIAGDVAQAYRAQYDSAYTRFERLSTSGRWRARTTDGMTHDFGMADHMGNGPADLWRAPLTRTTDPFGNQVDYFWMPVFDRYDHRVDFVIDHIDYTTNPSLGLTDPHARVRFTYEPFATRCADEMPVGAKLEHDQAFLPRWTGSRRLLSIITEVKNGTGYRTVRTVALSYDAAADDCNHAHGPLRMLTSIQETAVSPPPTVTTAMPAVQFSYGAFTRSFATQRTFSRPGGNFGDAFAGGYRDDGYGWPRLETMMLDYDGDGRLDRLRNDPLSTGCGFRWERNTGSGFAAGVGQPRVALPTFRWGQGSGQQYTEECSLAAQRSGIENQPNPTACNGQSNKNYLSYKFLDLDGDGFADLATSLDVDYRYFNPNLPGSLPPEWDPSCTPDDGMCPDLSENQLQGDEVCGPNERYSCDLDLSAVDSDLGGAGSVPCDVLMMGSAGPGAPGSSCPPKPRQPLQKCGGYVWVVYWNKGLGIDVTDLTRRATIIAPVPLDSNAADSSLGAKRSGFVSQFHAILDIDGDGYVDAITKDSRLGAGNQTRKTNLWYVFRGDGTGNFNPRANGLPYIWFAPYGSAFSVSSSVFTPNGSPEDGTSVSVGWAGVMDATGDGAPELLFRRPGDLNASAVTLFANRGQGFRNLGAVDVYFSQPPWLDALNYSFVANAHKPAGGSVVTQGDRHALVMPVDFDGDGRLDAYDARFFTDGGFLYAGDGTGEVMDGTIVTPAYFRTHLQAGTGEFRQRGELLDLDGDGLPEWTDDNGSQFVAHGEANDGRPLRLLNHIDNGSQGSIDVRYQASSNSGIDIPGTSDLGVPTHTWVVDTLTMSDASGSQPNATTTYRYGTPVWNADQIGRFGFRGFLKTRVTRPLGAVVDSSFDYSVDWSGRLSETSSYRNVTEAGADRPDLIETTTWDSFQLFAGTVKSFQATTRKKWTCSNGQTRAQCQAAGGALQVDSTVYVAQAAEGDASGLALLHYPRHVWRKRATGIQDGDRKFLSDHLLYSGPDHYRLRINLEQVLERVAGVDTIRRDVRHTWIANGSGPPGAFHQKTNAKPASGLNATELSYNELGLGLVTGRKKPQQFSTSSPARTTVVFNPATPVFPVETKNELDHLVKTDYDLGTGAVLSTRGPNSVSCGGSCIEWEEVKTEIDGFGRPIKIYVTTEDPDGTYRQELAQQFQYIEIAGQPRKVIEDHVITFGQPDTTRVETTFDGFGRVRTRKEYRFESGLPDPVDIYTYDAQGNLATLVTPDPSQDSTATVTYQYVHDPFDRTQRAIRPGTPASEVNWSYNGLATTRTEITSVGPQAQTTTTTDVFGRLVRVEERIAGTSLATTLYAHDALDNVRSITDADGLVTTLDHDFRSRRTAITRGARVFRYEYDLNGNLLREIAPVPVGSDPLQYTTSIVFDDLDRPTSRLAGVRALTTAQLNSFGHSAISYAYDVGPNGVGRMTGAGSLVVQRSFAYDPRGNVKTDTLGFALPASVGTLSDTRTVSREYNALGGVTSEKHGDDPASPTSTTTTFDRRGAAKTVTWQQMPPVTLATATRNGAGLTTSILGASVRQSWTYDQLGRVIDLKGSGPPGLTVRVSEQWTYYGLDDPETITTFRSGLSQRLLTFSYDDRHQLTDADDDINGYTGHFEYLASGRLDRAYIASVGAPMAPPRDVDYLYANTSDRDPEAIRRLSSNIGAQPILYTSDESGNIATRDDDGTGGLPSFKFIYDGDDQQRRATAPNLDNELYYYDHSGRRVLAVSRVSGGAITKVRLWHSSLEVEYPASGPAENFIHLSLGAQPVARIARVQGQLTGTAKRVIHNQLGHFLAAFTADGQALDAAFIYGPFGEILAQTGTTDDYLRRFNGKEQDQLTDLSYYGFRYFDPLSLTWSQADPLYRFAPDAAWDEPRRANLYAFSLNNPARMVDPDGEQSFDAILPGNGNAVVNDAFKEKVGQASDATSRVAGFAAKVAVVAATAVVCEPCAVVVAGAVSSGKNEGEILGDVVAGAVAIRSGGAKASAERGATAASSAEAAGKPSTLKPGPYARDSIPARGPGRDFTKTERSEVTKIGKESGCHTCGKKDPGTKSGDFVPDHQPPSATAKPGEKQRLYPHCLECSRRQGGQVRQKQ